MSRVLQRWAGASARRPWVALALAVLVSVGIGFGFSQGREADINELFLPGSLAEVQASERIEELYGGSAAELVLARLAGPLDVSAARAVLGLEADLRESGAASNVSGLGAVLSTAGGPASPTWSDDELRIALEETRERRPRDFFRVSNESWILIRAEVDPEAEPDKIVEDLGRVLGRHRANFTSLTGTGPAHVSVDQLARSASDLQILMPIAIGFVLVVLYAGTTSLRVSVAAVGLQAWAAFLAFATLPWLNVPFSPLLYSIGLLILGLGIDYQLHLVYAFTERPATENKVDRWRAAFARTGRPVFFTVATTIIGFGSFLASPIPQIQHWGLLILLGAGYSFLLAVTFLPAWIRAGSRPRGSSTPRWIASLSRRGGNGIWKARFPLLVLVVAGTTGMAWAASGVTLEEGIGTDAGAEGPIYDALSTIEERFGGQTLVLVLVESSPAAVWDALDRASTKVAALRGVSFVDSETQRARGANNGALPDPGGSTGSSGPPLSTKETTLVYVFVATDEASSVASSVRDILRNEGLPATPTGRIVLEDLGPRLVLEGLIRSTGVAFGLILVMLVIVFRRVRPTLAALTPLLLVLVWQFGAMRLLGIELNAVTGITTAMVIGIGVDYALHLVADVERGLVRRTSGGHAVKESVGHVGMALVTGTLTTVGVFGILSVSQQPQVQQFGAVSAIVVAAAFVLALVCLPFYYLGHPRPGSAAPASYLRCPRCTAVQAFEVAPEFPGSLAPCARCGVVARVPDRATIDQHRP